MKQIVGDINLYKRVLIMDVRNEIIDFINIDDNNGALLITGSWGCGKSYLVKHLISEINNKQEYAISVVSLFGINSVAMIHNRVKDEYLEFSSGLLGDKARKAYKMLRRVANESAKVTAAALPESVVASALSTGVSSIVSFDPLSFITVKNNVGLGDKKRKFAIVFDDFERCSITIKNLMGAINEYSENRAIKTILIADEEKINSDKYKEFKEKLISRTIKINPDHTETIHSIIKNYWDADEKYKTFLFEHENCLAGAFFHSGYNNLRAFKACLHDFKRVFLAWEQSGVPMDRIEDVLYKFCAIVYETKVGSYAKNDFSGYSIIVNDTKTEQQDAERNRIIQKYFPETFDNIFLSLSRWVVDGEWDEQAFIDNIKKCYTKVEVSHEQRFINYPFWDLQQEDIDKGLPLLLQRAYEGGATRDELIALLQKVHALKINEIPLPSKVDYVMIDQGLEKRKVSIRNGVIEEPKRLTFSQVDNIDSEAISLYKKIERMEAQMYAWDNRNLFIAFLTGAKKVSYYELKHKCLDYFDDYLFDLFINRFVGCSNGEKRELCWAFDGLVFNDSQYSDASNMQVSIINTKRLLKEMKLQTENTTDHMSVAIAKSFKKLLEEKIESMESTE